MTMEPAQSWDKIRLPGGIPLLLQRIPQSPPSGFRMGSRGNYSDEEPVHRVVIPSDSYLGTFVVTEQLYAAVAHDVPALRVRIDPSKFKGDNRPVENIDWREANHVCAWLSGNVPAKQLPSGFIRSCLPTEAEWEYACRAGTETDYYSGDGDAALAEVGWFEANSRNEAHPVDEKPESPPSGLRGMHGNVWEWHHDIDDSGAYRGHLDGDPDPGPRMRWNEWASGIAKLTRDDDDRFRVFREGSSVNGSGGGRSACRIGRCSEFRLRAHSFRVCLVCDPVRPGGAPEQEDRARADRGHSRIVEGVFSPAIGMSA